MLDRLITNMNCGGGDHHIASPRRRQSRVDNNSGRWSCHRDDQEVFGVELGCANLDSASTFLCVEPGR